MNTNILSAIPAPAFNFAPRLKKKTRFVTVLLWKRNAKWSLLAVILLSPSLLFAQPYSISWYKIAGGGGTITNGQLSVTGTIGQADAGGPMTGPGYVLTGGFWALYAVQTPGAPVLSIQLTATNTALVFWSSVATGYALQVTTNLATPNWVAATETVTNNGTIQYIISSPPTGNRFYRLKHP